VWGQETKNNSGNAGQGLELPSCAVLTQHNDNYRTGAYLCESQLTPKLVKDAQMRRKYARTLTGSMNGQLLYVPGLVIDGDRYDVLYATTGSNYVYALDANDGSELWSLRFIDPEDPRRGLSHGIRSTPVIDRETNTIYLVYSTKTRNDMGSPACEQPGQDITFWLTALDIRTGEELRTVKIEGSVPRSDGSVLAFYATNHLNRAGLLLNKGFVYVAFAREHQEECIQYHGWVIRYDAETFEQKGAFCTSPNVRGVISMTPTSGGGAGIWQGGNGLVGDRDGNIYFTTGNGFLNYANQTYGDSVVKLSSKEDTLEYAASFPPNDPRYFPAWDRLRIYDADLGSGAMMLIPETDYLIGGGKTGIWYLLDRYTMASVQEFPAFTNQAFPDIRDQGWNWGPWLYGGPAYWRGPEEDFAYVYQWSNKDHLKAYKYYFKTSQFDEDNPLVDKVVCPNSPGRLQNPPQPGQLGATTGGILSVSANGNIKETGIVWAILPNGWAIRRNCSDQEPDNPPNRLLAYNAETLELLWQTNLPSRSHGVPPTVADGSVFVPAGNQIIVYELDK
jgi:outer membrane protein assembly factor BamB